MLEFCDSEITFSACPDLSGHAVPLFDNFWARLMKFALCAN